jgi:molecular chaperone DnaK
LIFKKNEILPLKKTIYKRFSKSIAKGSSDKIIINIVEGKVGSMPGANRTIGYLEILGEELQDDIIKGSDLELEFEISESRDLKLNLYISALEQSISKSFVPNFQSDISTEKLISEIDTGLRTVNREIEKGLQEENYLAVQNLQELNVELGKLKEALAVDNFFGDSKHQLIDQKRKLLYQIDQINFLKNIEATIDEYKNVKEYLARNYDELIPVLKAEYEKIIKQEDKFLSSGDKYLIENKKNRLDEIADRLYFEKDESYLSIFINLKYKNTEFYRDYDKVESLFQEGDRCMEKSDYKALKAVCKLIFAYIKDTGERNVRQNLGKTGLK